MRRRYYPWKNATHPGPANVSISISMTVVRSPDVMKMSVSLRAHHKWLINVAAWVDALLTAELFIHRSICCIHRAVHVGVR